MDDPVSTAVCRAHNACCAALEEVNKIVNGHHYLTEIVGYYVAFKAAEETLFEKFKDDEGLVILADAIGLTLNDEVTDENSEGNLRRAQ